MVPNLANCIDLMHQDVSLLPRLHEEYEVNILRLDSQRESILLRHLALSEGQAQGDFLVCQSLHIVLDP